MNLSEQMYVDLKAQLPSLIDAIKVGVEYGGDLAHRVILFDIWSNILWACSILLFTLISGFVTYRGYPTADEDDFHQIVFIVSSVVFALSLVACVSGLPLIANTIIKDIFIPEIRIAELLSNLMNVNQLQGN